MIIIHHNIIALKTHAFAFKKNQDTGNALFLHYTEQKKNHVQKILNISSLQPVETTIIILLRWEHMRFH